MLCFLFFQAEDGIRDLVRSRGLGDVYKRQGQGDELNPETRQFQFGDMLEQIDFTESIRNAQINHGIDSFRMQEDDLSIRETDFKAQTSTCLLYTSDAADERSSVDLGGRRIIKKKKHYKKKKKKRQHN